MNQREKGFQKLLTARVVEVVAKDHVEPAVDLGKNNTTNTVYEIIAAYRQATIHILTVKMHKKNKTHKKNPQMGILYFLKNRNQDPEPSHTIFS